MALTGSLVDFDLSYIFQIVSQEGKTGRLILSTNAEQAHVVFDRGRIISAANRSKNMKKALLTYLVDAKKAPYATVRRLADQRRHNLQTLSKQFVQSKFAAEDELNLFARTMLEDLTCELFLWKEGTYRFDVLDNVDEYRIGTAALAAEAITMEAARRVDEWERLKMTIRPDVVFVHSRSTPRESCNVDPVDDPSDYLYSLIDGTTSVEFLCKRAFISEFRVYETLGLLIQEEQIVALSDKLSLSIHEALQREVKVKRMHASDVIIASAIAVLLAVLVLIISAIVPDSAINSSARSVIKDKRRLIAENQAKVKTTAAWLYFHAVKGYEPKKTADLALEALLSPRDLLEPSSNPENFSEFNLP